MRKNSFKIILLSLLLVSALILSGCGAAQLAKPTRAPGAPVYDITGDCSISVSDNVITVSGKTNFDKDIRLNISVVSQDGRTIDSFNLVQPNPNEQLSHEFTIDDKYEGVTKVTGYITCAPTLYGKHPEGVYQKYGSKFECIETDVKNYIWNNDGVVVLFASETAALSR